MMGQRKGRGISVLLSRSFIFSLLWRVKLSFLYLILFYFSSHSVGTTLEDRTCSIIPQTWRDALLTQADPWDHGTFFIFRLESWDAFEWPEWNQSWLSWRGDMILKRTQKDKLKMRLLKICHENLSCGWWEIVEERNGCMQGYTVIVWTHTLLLALNQHAME